MTLPRLHSRIARFFAGVAMLAGTAALGVGGALAASHATLSITAKPGIVLYTKSAKIAGRLSTGKKGVKVALEERVFPFSGSFTTVGHTATGSNGTYSFTRSPALATEYRATTAGAKSGTATVYVIKKWKLLRCEFTKGSYKHTACGTQAGIPQGTYTLHVSVEFLYPAGVYAAEAAKPVYTYYGKRYGTNKPPPTLALRGTLPQHGHGGDTTVYDFSTSFTIGKSAWGWALNWCTKTSETSNGFGLPGSPGSHGCGAGSLSVKLSPNALG